MVPPEQNNESKDSLLAALRLLTAILKEQVEKNAELEAIIRQLRREIMTALAPTLPKNPYSQFPQ